MAEVTYLREEKQEEKIAGPDYEAYAYLTRIGRYILDIAEIALVLRFIFKLLGANPGSSFVNFLYGVTNPLAAPFRGIFQSTPVDIGVAEWSSLVAMLSYALIAYLFFRLLRLFR